MTYHQASVLLEDLPAPVYPACPPGSWREPRRASFFSSQRARERSINSPVFNTFRTLVYPACPPAPWREPRRASLLYSQSEAYPSPGHPAKDGHPEEPLLATKDPSWLPRCSPAQKSEKHPARFQSFAHSFAKTPGCHYVRLQILNFYFKPLPVGWLRTFNF